MWEKYGYIRDVKYFKPKDFSESPIHCRQDVIYKLDDVRQQLGRRIFPSPKKGALARFDREDKTSTHYAGDRLSFAVDVFIEGVPLINFTQLLSLGLYGGLGIYLDTKGVDGKQWVMFHLDLRHVDLNRNIYPALIWFRIDGKYVYPHTDTQHLKLFTHELMLKKKRHGCNL